MFNGTKAWNASSTQVKRIRLYTWIAAIVWTVLIAGSFVWEYRKYEEQLLAVSRVKALTAFEWGRLYRVWVSRQGGIYVPVTPNTPANPLLSHVAERDVATPSGRTLTLMNSAYMARQVFDSVDKPEQVGRGRITSLNPINPENKPDPWEERALRAFERGTKEVSEVQVVNGRSYLRLIRASITEKPCLQCHGRQGYKVGDIRGGIEVTVPISDIMEASRPRMNGNALAHGLIWILGLGLMGTGARKLNGSVFALQESEERYRAVVEDQTEVICRFQADGTVLFANDAYCRFFGKTGEELFGNKWQPQAFSDDIPMIEEKLGEMSPANPVIKIENRVYSSSGQVHWMQFVNRGIFDGEGRLLEIQAIGRDITERMLAEESARKSERFKQATIDAISANICVLDEQGTILSVNRGWRDFAACNPPVPEHIGAGANYLAICDGVQGDDREQAGQFAAGIRSVIAGEADFYAQEYPCHSENEQRWFQGRVTRFTAADQARIVVAHINITERKQAEEALAKALDELESQVQERTISLTMANRQLHLEIEERKRIEQDILDHQKKLQAMTRELALAEERERDRIAGELHDHVGQRLILGKMKLDSLVSRLPCGQFEIDAEEIDRLLDQSIQDIRSLTFQLRPPILASAGLEAAVQWLGEELKKDFGLQIEFTDDNEPKPMRYEVRSTVFQVVRELLLNVAKHARTKHVTVSMKRENDSVLINIEDDGIGFDTTEVSKRKAKDGGFGLFSITQRIDYLGGGLFIDTLPGKGTRATIMVPLDEAHQPGR